MKTNIIFSLFTLITLGVNAQVLLKDIRPGSSGSDPKGFTKFNNQLYFVANDGTHGSELWKSNGSTSGTVMVKDINSGSGAGIPPSALNSSSGYPVIAEANGFLFFPANDGVHGIELWKSDGSEAGTVMVKDINLGNNSSLLGSGLSGGARSLPVASNNVVFFRASDGVHGNELWKSDGTEAGTVMVKDIAPNAASSNPYALTNANGTLFFKVVDNDNTIDLWKSDGTTLGTVKVRDNIEYYDPSVTELGVRVKDLGAIGKDFFFNVDGPANSYGLWKTDGTVNGTIHLDSIRQAHFVRKCDGSIFYNINSAYQPLYVSDGTAGGVSIVTGFSPGNGTHLYTIFDIECIDDRLYFCSAIPGYGNRSVFSYNLSQGLTQRFQIYEAREFYKSGNQIYFRGGDVSNNLTPVSGIELWSLSGPMADINLIPAQNGSGTQSSSPVNFIDVNGILFFSATDGVLGRELYKVGEGTTTTSINEVNNLGINIFPNPTTGNITLQLSEAGNYNLNIYNSIGQQVYNGTTQNTQEQVIDLGNAAKGIYYVQVGNEKESISKTIVVE